MHARDVRSPSLRPARNYPRSLSWTYHDLERESEREAVERDRSTWSRLSEAFVRLSFVPEPVSLIIAESINEEEEDEDFDGEESPDEGDFIHHIDSVNSFEPAQTPVHFRDEAGIKGDFDGNLGAGPSGVKEDPNGEGDRHLAGNVKTAVTLFKSLLGPGAVNPNPNRLVMHC
jgi:hypothetical protein